MAYFPIYEILFFKIFYFPITYLLLHYTIMETGDANNHFVQIMYTSLHSPSHAYTPQRNILAALRENLFLGFPIRSAQTGLHIGLVKIRVGIYVAQLTKNEL